MLEKIGIVMLMILAFECYTVPLQSQNLEVEGKVKISNLALKNLSDSVVVIEPDGTLALREASTLINHQVLSISNDTIFLTDGGLVVLPPDHVEDADADATNELQNLWVQGDTIFISGGNFIVLPGLTQMTALAQDTVQQLLNLGVTPCEVVDLGYAIEDLYGKMYNGGLIFYLNVSTCTGLVAAPFDQSVGAPWGCEGVLINPNMDMDTAVGVGHLNTVDILDTCMDNGIAAQLCDDLVLGVYDDWFLPSTQENLWMFRNIGEISNKNFLTESAYYWSSSEFDDDESWILINKSYSEGGGIDPREFKSAAYHVRAVRAFP